MPGAANPQAYNRYSYTLNNPVRYTDPTGHAVSCDAEDDCKEVRQVDKLSATAYLKESIHKKSGITMSDEGGKNWDAGNLLLAYSRLDNLNTLLKGKLKSVIGGATFDLAEYHRTKENCKSGLCTYGGLTAGTHITFSTTGGNAIVKMNFFHEFGHMLNSLPGSDNIFSDQIHSPNFVSGNGKVNRDALINRADVFVQASSGAVTEQWADVFANYAAGNINLSNPNGPGIDMYNFITGALDEFLSDPTK